MDKLRVSSRGTVLAVVVAVAVLVLGAAVVPRVLGGPRVELPAGDPAFAADEVTWAQGSEIHFGEETFDVSPWLVRSMVRTSYGFVLEVSEKWGFDEPTQTKWYDGSTLTDLPGDLRSVQASPDGRYLGWIDYDGPRRINGRVAEAVVLDLKSGQELIRTHRGMGGGDPTVGIEEQYAEGGPGFLGFDEASAAYWLDVGDGYGHRWRLDPATGEVEDLGEAGPDEPFDVRLAKTGRGWDAHHRDGGDAEESIVTGFLSPDQRWLFRTEQTGKVPVEDAESGQDVTPDYGVKWVFFGGWRSPDTYYVLAHPRFDFSIAPRPDGSRGTLLSCSLPSGACEELTEIRDTNTLVFPNGASNTAEVY